MPPKFGGAPKCPRCNKSVYAAEKTVYDNQDWHAVCIIAYNNEKGQLTNKGGFWSSAAKGGETQNVPSFPSSAHNKQQSEEAAKFCKNCGNAFKSGDAFCEKCGSKR